MQNALTIFGSKYNTVCGRNATRKKEVKFTIVKITLGPSKPRPAKHTAEKERERETED